MLTKRKAMVITLCAWPAIIVTVKLVSMIPGPPPEPRHPDPEFSESCKAAIQASLFRAIEYSKIHGELPPDDVYWPPCAMQETEAMALSEPSPASR